MSRNDHRPAVACAAVTILCLGVLLWGRNPLLNLAAAGPLVLFLPGWAALRALDAEPEDWLASAVLRTALSLAIVVIVGLLLHLASSIIRPAWLQTLGAITLTACAISLVTRGRTSVAGISQVGRARAARASYRSANAAMTTIAIGLAAAAVALSVGLTLRLHEFYTTQLWVVPKQDAPDEVVIGLRNAEAGDEKYSIELLVDRRLIQSWNDVSLKPGETWTTTFRWVGFGQYPRRVEPLRQSATGQDAPTVTISQRVGLGASPQVEALVYRGNDRSAIYRRVWSAPQCAVNDGAHGRPPCVF